MTSRGLCLPVLLVALATSVSAQEFQVASSTSAALGSMPGSSFLLSERLDGQFSLPFDAKGGGFEVKAHLQYGVPAGFGADLDTLSLTWVYDRPAPDLKSFRWTLGRFVLTEPTGRILNHSADGTKFVMDYGWVGLTVSAAYTGLVQRSSSGTALSLSDVNAAEDLLASPRFIGSLEAVITPVPQHQVTLGLLAQQDLNDRKNLVYEWATVNNPDRGGAMDTQYVTLAAEGPVVPGWSYSAFATLGTGTTLSWIKDPQSPTGYQYEYKPVLSALAGGEVSYSLPSLLGSSWTAKVVYASGDSDAQSPVEGNTAGDLNLFTPITGASLGAVFSPALMNVICYEIGGNLRPLSNLPVSLGVKALGFQRALVGLVNAPGVQRLGPVWIGQELDMSVAWKVLSDVSLTGSTGVFVPSSGTYAPGSAGATLQYMASVGVNLVF